MKRKIIVVVLILIALAFGVIYAYEAKIVPDRKFQRDTGVFDSYATVIATKEANYIHERLEMSVEEYKKLKQSFGEKWNEESPKDVQIDKNMFSEEERNGACEVYCAKSSASVPIGLAKHSCWETLIVVIHEDKVYAEYIAEMKRPRGLFGMWR